MATRRRMVRCGPTAATSRFPMARYCSSGRPGRELRTEAEAAARAKKPWVERIVEGNTDPARRAGRDRRSEPGSLEDVSGAYNAVFTPGRDHLKPSRRTSLIVDPPDGRIPPVTPE